MTNCVYTDFCNNILSEQQIRDLNDYWKHIYEDGELKITEFWSYNWMKKKVVPGGGLYFVPEKEDYKDVIESFAKADGRWTIYYNKKANTQGDALWEYQIIYRGTSENLGKIVFDSQKREIAETVFSELRNRYDRNLKKFYGDPKIFSPAYYGAPTFTFFYDEVTGKPTKAWCEYGSEADNEYSINQFFKNENIMSVFSWSEHPYYHSFYPILT
ncbi:hypothetical protein D0C36_17315 [Mucilaginibacter conchicola]|uniref:Uncharacterized protein n=2 Tax=Mucilaginibacter conchicola TaxID=2303333 RepID=A0A372NPZ0_9SPHI|nr:hypothetical protein D0C36_17315 [Mucilaginibacter conchicola]